MKGKTAGLICSAMMIALLMLACSEKGPDEEKLMNTYKSILITRAEYPDTAIANPKVRALLEKQGYTYETFYKDMHRMSLDKPGFLQMMDSLRGELDSEIKRLDSIPTNP